MHSVIFRKGLDLKHAVAGALARGETVRLVGFGAFGAFGVRSRPARTARNPATGASIAVPASRSVSFRAGKGGSGTR